MFWFDDFLYCAGQHSFKLLTILPESVINDINILESFSHDLSKSIFISKKNTKVRLD